MAVEIRPVRPEEHDEAGRVTAEAYREFSRPDSDWAEYLAHVADVADRAQRTLVLVAVEDGRILGTVTLELDERVEAGHDHREGQPLPPHEAHVRMLGVVPDARGRGIGRWLMDACVEEALRRGKTLLTLNTTKRMKAAQAMYEGMGFRRQEDWVFDDGFVLLSYALDLEPSGG